MFIYVTVTYMIESKGILILFPFRDIVDQSHILTQLSCHLGSANPWRNTLLMEPLSTSAIKVLTWIIATTTKIFTKGRYTPFHKVSFFATFTSAYLQPNYISTTVVSK